MPTARRILTQLQNQDDVNITPGSGIDNYGVVYDHDTAKFIARKVQRGEGTYNVLDYGATGNGVTDDTTAIQTAINAANHTSTGTGGVIYFPGGTYKITSTITLSASNSTIWYNLYFRGDGGTSSQLVWGGAANGTLFSTGPLYYCTFEGLYFNGNNTADYAFFFGSVDTGSEGVNSGCRFINCDFAYAKYAFGCSKKANVMGAYFETCKFRNATYAGFTMGGANTDQLTFVRCDFTFSPFGVGSFSGTGTPAEYTSSITGSKYTFDPGVFVGDFYSCLFVSNSEADVFCTNRDEGVLFHGCGGEGSRTLLADMMIFGSAANNSNDAGIINITGCYYHGFGSAADSLNDPFIQLNGGAILTLSDFRLWYTGGTYPRTRIDLVSGFLTLSDVCIWGADMADPDILDYTVCTGLKAAEAYHVVILHYGEDANTFAGVHQWKVPIKTITGATPTVDSPAVEIYKTANTGSTTMTDFASHVAGQRWTVVIGDTKTTVDFTGTNLKGNSGSDWSASANDWMECVSDGTTVYCSVHEAS